MRVKIKTWDEMLGIEGSFIDCDEAICLPCGVRYTTYMENKMPEDRIIEVFIDDNDDMRWDNGDKKYPYYIEDDMIEGKYELVKITDINTCCDSALDEDF